MKHLIGAVALAGGVAFAASAGEVTPTEIKFDDGSVAMSVSGAAGDAANGRNVFMNRKKGNCLACHTNSDMPEQSFHGEVGPPLDGAADRWSEAELRGIVANAKMTFEDTIMPAFYRTSGFNRNQEKFEGKSILTAQEVEDVVAYLKTLKEE